MTLLKRIAGKIRPLVQPPAIAPSVSVLIPSMFDSKLMLELCIRSIQKNTNYPNYEIVVCDAGIDQGARDFLDKEQQRGAIRVIKATDWERPKDDLARAARGEYMLFMHDDVYIKRADWISRRMRLMQADTRNAIVGQVVPNYDDQGLRFFPLGLLVQRKAANQLGLVWGKQVAQGLDTGAIAYRQFSQQRQHRHVPCDMASDIHHFTSMTWPKYKEATDPEIAQLVSERDRKLRLIQRMLHTGSY